MTSLRVRIGILGLALLAGSAAPASPASAAAAPSPTVEEQRLDQAVPREILERSGFDAVPLRFTRALGTARSYAEARKVVVRQGSALWKRAVDRAQGRGLLNQMGAKRFLGRVVVGDGWA